MRELALSININGTNQKIECPPGMDPRLCGGDPGMLNNIILVGVQFLFLVAIILTFIYLIYGGMDWLMSRGEKEKIANAKRKITFAIIGLAIVFLSFFIIQVLEQMFGVKGFV
jgi:hypothetical protein